MKKLLALGVILSSVFMAGCKELIPTVYAQSLPIVKTVAWDANAASDNVLNYTVTLDGAVVGNPTGTTQLITITSVGNHTVSVTATNVWGTSLPSSLTFTVVVPARPANVRIQ